MPRAALVLVAAGRGERLGAGRPKALVEVGHGPRAAPVVVHALRTALRCRSLSAVVVVAPPDPESTRLLAAAVATVEVPDGVALEVVPGGAERSRSVAHGLRALPPDVDVVLVHDAARALTPVEVFDRVVAAVEGGHDAVTPAVPVTDTVKQVVALEGDGAGARGATERVVTTLDRSVLRAVQTPQGFRRATLERAHAQVRHAVTDDCGMVEALGGTVAVVAGSARALKITTAPDLAVAAAWLAEEDAAAASAPARSAVPVPVPVLVVLAGLPGVGKTTLARALCRRWGAAHLRVDTVEQGLVRGGLDPGRLHAEGYGATYAVAADQLAVGLSVVADMVNDVPEARQGWDAVAEAAGVRQVRVLVECSDADVHRHRVEDRVADLEGHRLPGWQDVLARDVAPWPEADVRVDTARLSLEETVTLVEEACR